MLLQYYKNIMGNKKIFWEVLLMNWKCENCGYTFECEPDKLPKKCPSCGQECTFLNVTCYNPDCQLPEGPGFDPRIGNK